MSVKPIQSKLLPGVCRAGIDPGITGAIAVVDDDKIVAVADMPTEKPHRRTIIDARALISYLRGVAMQFGDPMVYVEHQQAMVGGEKRDGAVSAFSLGQSYGIVRASIAAVNLPSSIIHPNTWKAKAGLRGHPNGKDAAIAVTKQLFGNAHQFMGANRHRNIARCDAILIATFGDPTA